MTNQKQAFYNGQSEQSILYIDIWRAKDLDSILTTES